MNAPSPIRAVALDAVGVLIRPARPVAETYADVARRFGSSLDSAAIGSRFRHAFGAQELADEQAGWRVDEAREERRWRAIVRDTLEDVADGDAAYAALFEHFAQPAAWSVSPELAAWAAELDRSGIPVAVASNFDARLHRVLADNPVREHLRAVVVSSEVGWRKPASPFFAATAAALDRSASEILFVGDDRRNDFEGASAAGMRALLYVDGEPLRLAGLRFQA